MTATKDEELKALEQIKKIIKGLGPDSYIGAAIDETVLNLAADNIGNDWLITTTEKIEGAEIKLEEARKEIRELNKERQELKTLKDIETNRVNEAGCKADNLRKELAEAEIKRAEEVVKNEQLNGKIEALEAETIKLKAKLYDLMTA